MPVKEIRKTVGDYEVRITQFHAIRGFKMKSRLLKLILPVLAPLAGTTVEKMASKNVVEQVSLLDRNIDLEAAIPKAFSSLSDSLDEEVFFQLMLDLLSETWVDKKQITKDYFNDLFIGNYMLAYKLAFEVIRANNFFDFGSIAKLFQVQQPAEETM